MSPRNAASLLATLCCTAASAQPRSFSLDEALARAADRSPAVQRARLERRSVEAEAVGAGLFFPANPVVSVAGGSRSDLSGSVPPAAGAEFGVRVEQQVEIGGQRGARLTEVERAVDAARARERVALSETRARVRSAYVGTLLAREQVRFSEQRLELAERVRTSVQQRAGLGAAAEVDVNLAILEAGRAEQEVAAARVAAVASDQALRRLLDLPRGPPLELTSVLELPAAPGEDTEALVTAARNRRAELAALTASRSQLDATLELLSREVIPSPTLFFEWASQQPQQSWFGGGIAIPIPLWRQNQGAKARVRAAQERLDGERVLVEREVESEVEVAAASARALATEAVRWEREVAPAAAANAELVARGWQAGKFDFFRVVQALRESAEARALQLRLLGTAWAAVIDLDRVTGNP
ncbi:MAG TPA: TolC family protein [Myxococcaceae bacterium]|nr:TolC family protein [Myxococcaceae bacterium]